MTKSRDIIRDWTSKKWHKAHNWKTGTGKFIKKLLNRRIRHKGNED
jgi:hypothetical protein